MADGDGFIAESMVVAVNIPAIPTVGVDLGRDKIDTRSGRLSSKRQLDNVQETHHTSILQPNQAGVALGRDKIDTKQTLQKLLQLRNDRTEQITKDGGFYTQSGRLSKQFLNNVLETNTSIFKTTQQNQQKKQKPLEVPKFKSKIYLATEPVEEEEEQTNLTIYHIQFQSMIELYQQFVNLNQPDDKDFMVELLNQIKKCMLTINVENKPMKPYKISQQDLEDNKNFLHKEIWKSNYIQGSNFPPDSVRRRWVYYVFISGHYTKGGYCASDLFNMTLSDPDAFKTITIFGKKETGLLTEKGQQFWYDGACFTQRNHPCVIAGLEQGIALSFEIDGKTVFIIGGRGSFSVAMNSVENLETGIVLNENRNSSVSHFECKEGYEGSLVCIRGAKQPGQEMYCNYNFSKHDSSDEEGSDDGNDEDFVLRGDVINNSDVSNNSTSILTGNGLCEGYFLYVINYVLHFYILLT